MTQEHSPLPWSVDPHNNILASYDTDAINPDDGKPGDCPVVAKIPGMFGASSDTAQANAAFIVRAVNSHDALVSALKEMVLFARQHEKLGHVKLDPRIQMAEATLAQAEKEEGV